MASTIAPRSTKYKMAAINKMLMSAPGSQRFASFMNYLALTLPSPYGKGRVLLLIQFQYSHERVLGDLDIPDHLQTFLALLLFFEQFLFACDIAAITF